MTDQVLSSHSQTLRLGPGQPMPYLPQPFGSDVHSAYHERVLAFELIAVANPETARSFGTCVCKFGTEQNSTEVDCEPPSVVIAFVRQA